MAATFSTLSNELILEICRFLTAKNLARLSLCSKLLYELAQPDLYFTFTQTHKRAVPALIRTLLAKPHLAQYVRTFNGHPFLQHHPTGWQIQITIEDDLRLRGALEELRVNWVRDEPGTVSSPSDIFHFTVHCGMVSGRLNVVKDLKRTNQSNCQFWKKSTFD
jgi:hypothetical protein